MQVINGKNLSEQHCAIITAYKGKKELSALLSALSVDFVCYVHIDKKNEELFKGITSQFPKVVFHSFYPVVWGGMNI